MGLNTDCTSSHGAVGTTHASQTPTICVHPLFASTAEAQKEDAQMHFSKRTFITRGELATELGLTKATIRKWEVARDFPAPLPGSGRVPLYKTAEVTAWLETLGKDQS